MISILEAISPTARQLLTPGDAQYEFTVTWRHSCGANVARCHGATASSTNCPEIAAKAAAMKHWHRFLGISGVDGTRYELSLAYSGEGLFTAIFTRS